ncbi:MAG: peptidoglycan-binding domain-containing protein, partial [bacterium]
NKDHICGGTITPSAGVSGEINTTTPVVPNVSVGNTSTSGSCSNSKVSCSGMVVGDICLNGCVCNKDHICGGTITPSAGVSGGTNTPTTNAPTNIGTSSTGTNQAGGSNCDGRYTGSINTCICQKHYSPYTTKISGGITTCGSCESMCASFCAQGGPVPVTCDDSGSGGSNTNGSVSGETPEVKPNTTATNYSFTRTLKLGFKGSDVTSLQSMLGISPTGYFGTVTLSKLKLWQVANGLTPDGVFGPSSQKKLKDLE